MGGCIEGVTATPRARGRKDARAQSLQVAAIFAPPSCPHGSAFFFAKKKQPRAALAPRAHYDRKNVPGSALLSALALGVSASERARTEAGKEKCNEKRGEEGKKKKGARRGRKKMGREGQKKKPTKQAPQEERGADRKGSRLLTPKKTPPPLSLSLCLSFFSLGVNSGENANAKRKTQQKEKKRALFFLPHLALAPDRSVLASCSLVSFRALDASLATGASFSVSVSSTWHGDDM